MTLQQAAALQFIREYQRAHRGVSPSRAEIAAGLGLKSKSGTHRILCALEQLGEIKRDPRSARSIHLLKAGEAVEALSTAVARVFAEEGRERGYAILRDIVAGQAV